MDDQAPAALSVPPAAFAYYRPDLAPDSSAYKIKVRQAALIKLDKAFFDANLPKVPLSNLNKLHIQNLGGEVAFHVEGDGDNVLETGEAVYFYGVPYTGEEGDWTQPSDTWQHGDFTDENVYWVFCSTGLGTQMATRPVDPAGTDATHFRDTRVFEVDSQYMPFDPVRNDDLWLWKSAWWFKGPPDNIQKADHAVTVPGVESILSTASMTLTVRGNTYDDGLAPDHRVQVSVNGTALGSPFTFDGKGPHTVTFSFQQNALLGGTQTNTVRVEVTDPTLLYLSRDRIETNRFTLTYYRLFEAYGNALRFPADQAGARYPIGGFTSNAIAAADVTNPEIPVWLTGLEVTNLGGSKYRATLSRGAASGTPAYLVAVPAVPAAADVAEDTRSAGGLLADAAGKQWVLVAPPAWLAPTVHASITALADQRTAQGHQTWTVSMEDIDDEFAYGLHTPLALRAFFQAVYALPPVTCPACASDLVAAVLLGDGTLDYKNSGGYGAQNVVPTCMIHDETSGTAMVPFGQYSWDNTYACVAGGDLIPDFYLGRVPALTADDVTRALTKIVNFSAPADFTYQKGALFATGCRDGAQWENYQNQNAALVTPVPPHTVSKMYYRLADWNCLQTDTDPADTGTGTGTPDLWTAAGKNWTVNAWTNYFLIDGAGKRFAITANTATTLTVAGTPTSGAFSILDGLNDFNEALTGAFNAGQGTVSFVGHGSYQFWDDHALLTLNDLPHMTNAAKPAVVLNADCLTSAFFFSLSHPGILEQLLLSAGGSAASGGPGGFMYNYQSDEVLRPFYEALFGMDKERLLGALFHGVVAALDATGDARVTRGYVVMGDPLAAYAVPVPGTPQGLGAVVDCRRVTLTWSPPPGGFTGNYRVFRADTASGPWTVLENKALTTTYADATGTAGQTYYYRVTARDAVGYEGKGSSIVSATPQACAPPAPQGLACADPGFGGRLEVTWTAGPAGEIAGYRVYYGPAPGDYTGTMEVLCACGYAMLSGLTDGAPVFVTVKAFAVYGGPESDPAPEVSGVPTAARRWSPPQMVYPLKLSRDPSGRPALTWDLPALDLWGQAAAVARCSVYRTALPSLPPDRASASADRLAWIDASACPGGHCQWTDPAPPAIGYYDVTCQTALGEESPIGGPPPAPPAGLLAAPVGTGQVLLWWSPVTQTMEGGAAAVGSYLVFPDPRTATRPDAQNRTGLAGQVTEPWYQGPLGSTGLHYFIMAVDARGNVGPY